MDLPACNVCHVSLDEEEHQPRHLGCSHDACTSCIKALIINGSLQCPMCRRVMKANKPDDLPINHGVVQILRLFKGFKGFKMSENKANEEGATAYIKEVCSVHKHTTENKCISCNIWICVHCEEFHIPDIGCEIQDYNAVLKKAKTEHNEKVETTKVSIQNNLSSLSSKISEIDSEKKILEEKLEKLDNFRESFQKAVEEGTKALSEVVAASAMVDKASTLKELNERVEHANGWHQFVQVWCKKNAKSGLGDSLIEKLKAEQEVYYASMDINGEISHCKLTIEDNIYLHCFRIKGFNINESSKIFPYDQVQSQLPAVRDLVFLDLAICGEVKGRVTIRLRQDLPVYAKNIPLLFTGEMGHSILGLCCYDCNTNNLGIIIKSITDKIHNLKRGANAEDKATQGSTLAYWNNGNIEEFFIYHEQNNYYYNGKYEVFGQVETGLDIVKLCRKNKSQKEVTVADCGLVIKEDLLKEI